MCSDLVPFLDDYRGHELIAFYTFAITMAYLAVAMRFVSQRISRGKIGLDDYLVVVALVSFLSRRTPLEADLPVTGLEC